MQTQDVLAGAATVATIGLFLTGIPICQKIIKNGHTKQSSFFPILMMFVGSVLWLKYGLMVDDITLLIVNGTGASLSFVYCLIYYYYTATPHATLIHRQLFLGFLFLSPPLIYVQFHSPNHDDAVLIMGYTCATIGVFCSGSPLSAVIEVVRTRSTECMSFPLSLAACIGNSLWFLYGYCKHDLFLQVPNLVGVLLCLSQLALFYKYGLYGSSRSSTAASRIDKIHSADNITSTGSTSL